MSGPRALRVMLAGLTLVMLGAALAFGEDAARKAPPDPDPGLLEFLGSVEGPPAPAAGPAAPIAWSSLSPMQQKVLSRYGSQWKSLPPERQQALVHGSERWLGMSAEQRDQARERFQHFQSLPPEQRHAL